MPSVFETSSTTAAIPITFATKATWDAVSAGLPAPARQFALANGFAAKPGPCLILPAADGQIAQVIFGLEDKTAKSRDLFRPGALPACCRQASTASPTRRTMRGLPRSPSRSAATALAATASRRRRGAAGAAGWRRCRRTRAHRGGGLACPRPHQHAVERHGAGRTGAGRARLATRFGASFSGIVGDELATRTFR